MENPQAYQENFNRIFSNYRGKRIAIYGTGQNARLIAEYVSGYTIIGFISRDGTEGMLSGQVILSIDVAITMADVIIIAATMASTNIVYSRIREIVPPEINILNLYGELLNEKEPYREYSCWEKSEKKLCSKIDLYTTISFDIFDTLIMRRVLKPEDIFEKVEYRGNTERRKNEFKQWRMDAEQSFRLKKQIPSFHDIYKWLAVKRNVSEETIEQWKKWEIEKERQCIIPRNRMVEIYHTALSAGKKIFFTSDMYFSSEEIRGFLKQCGIKEGYELFVSCEFHASKQDGSLYQKLKEKAGKDKILHIGDHKIIDGIMAEKNGVDSFTILSGYDLLASSSFVQIFDCVQTKDDRDYLGYFISVMFNNPFVLSEHTGKIQLSSYRDIALAIYPITMMFLTYIIKNSQKYECILFPSRDGFFLYQLYERIRSARKGLKLPDAKYIYVSRMTLSRAAIHDEKSFIVLLDKLFHDRTLNCKEYFLNQFNAELSEEYNVPIGRLIEQWGEEELIRKLKSYCPEIIEKLRNHKALYLEYLHDLKLNQYHLIAMADIVSYGTQVYCLSQILEKTIDMIALGTTDIPNSYIDDEKRVFSVYGNVNKIIDGAVYSCSKLSVLHLLLEMLYASTDGQLTGISENGMPLFQNKTSYNRALITGVQEELMKMIEETEKSGFHYENISPEFAMGMMQLLLHQHADIDEKLKEQFLFSDPYMGGVKEVNLMDLL